MGFLKNKDKTRQQGAVALFIVVFTALLVTTITISFMQLMVRDHQQAAYSDLSESAYDSAMAGVEDAKRLLLLDYDCQNGVADPSVNCTAVSAALAPSIGELETECDTLVRGEIVGEVNNETLIQQQTGDSATALNQAYTCVKVKQQTEDYIGSIEPDEGAALVPLRAMSPFDKIVISWYLSKSGGAVNLAAGPSRELPQRTTTVWPEDRPALLRAQLINGRGSFQLSNLDESGYSNTLFMYPSRTGAPTAEFALDGRRGVIGGEPYLASCRPNVPSGEYACKVTIDVNPAIVGGSQTAFLNLMAFYNPTDYKIELLNGSDPAPVRFDSVQPEVDSTGRANDLFRRVVSRVELNNTFNYPVAALETRNSICKNFSVTTEANGYWDHSADCDPLTND